MAWLFSTNLKTNLDEAIAQRFQSVINIIIPNEEKHLKIWKNTLSCKTHPENKIDLNEIAGKFELTGGEILNEVVYCSLKAYRNKTNEILLADILNGIKRELSKEGRTMPQCNYKSLNYSTQYYHIDQIRIISIRKILVRWYICGNKDIGSFPACN